MNNEATWEEIGPPALHELTQEFVETFRAYETYEGDRDRTSYLGGRRIQRLESHLDAGHFYTPVWSLAECLFDGKTRRVDGGHSSKMLAARNGDFPRGMHVVVRRFLCRTTNDLASLFMHFDPRTSARTQHEKIHANRAADPALMQISPSDIRYAVDGIALYQYLREMDQWEAQAGPGRTRPSRLEEDERIALMHSHQNYIAWVHKYVKDRMLRRTGIAAAMWITSRRNLQGARAFWDLVQSEAAVPPKNPTRKLARFLRDSVADNIREKKWDNRAFYVKCIHAWNAWRNNAPTALRYCEEAALPRVSA